MTDRLRLGVLGAGMIVTNHDGLLPNMGLLAGRAEVVAIASRTLARAQQVAAGFAIPAVYESLELMLASGDVDAVVNLTPIPVHGETNLAILAAGRHVVTDKPLATSMAEADAIVALAAERGLTVVCAPPDLLWPSRRELRRLVVANAVGRPTFARVRSSHAGPAAYAWPADPTWFYQEGSGPLLDMGVYGIQQITGMLGPAKRVSALSGITDRTRRVRGGPFDGMEIAVTADDNVLLMLDFGHSTFAVVDATFNVHASLSPHIEIFGREGTLALLDGVGPDGFSSVHVFQAYDAQPQWRTADLTGYPGGGKRQEALGRALLVEELVDCLDEGRAPILSAEHARHTLEIMLAAQESARTGVVVELATTFDVHG
jgi:predicted dehydrogenase